MPAAIPLQNRAGPCPGECRTKRRTVLCNEKIPWFQTSFRMGTRTEVTEVTLMAADQS